MTYLELVNDVLIRLRENSVASIGASSYSRLIGKFVNDGKRQVEDAWKWDCHSVTTTITTEAGTSNYTVTGSGRRQKYVTVNDSTNDARLTNVPNKWIQDQQQLANNTNSEPGYYAWNGFDGTDSKVELWPVPDGVYSIKFNMYVPQVELSLDADELLVPSEPVIFYAYARAIAERGEDGGMMSSEAYGLYKASLSDAISVEATRFVENDCWEPC